MADDRRLKTSRIDFSKGKSTIPTPLPAGTFQTTLFELTTPKVLKSLLPMNTDQHQRGREQDATEEIAGGLAKGKDWVKVTTIDRRAFYWSPKLRRSQWELPHELSGVRKKTAWQQFTCKEGVVKWFDTVNRSVSLDRPRALESHEEKKERIKSEAKTKARAARVAESQQLDGKSRRPKPTPVKTKELSLHEGTQKLLKGMKNSPKTPLTLRLSMRAEIGEAQVRVSTSGLWRTNYLYSTATEEHELGTLIESGLDPCIGLNTNSPSLQESLLMLMTKKKTGIKIPKVIRLRLKAWYERNYLKGKFACQKAYKDYLWEHRADRHLYFPARHAGPQQSGEFKAIIKSFTDQVKRLKNGKEREEIADLVGFLFLGQLDRNESVNVQAWNFEAFDVSDMSRTPYHPTPYFPDYDHVDLVEYFSQKNVRNIVKFLKGLPRLLEATELELVDEETEEDEEVVPVDFRWVSRPVGQSVQPATHTNWPGHGLNRSISWETDRTPAIYEIGVVPFEDSRKMEENNESMPDRPDNLDLSSDVYRDDDLADGSSLLDPYESCPNRFSPSSSIGFEPWEDVTAGQPAAGISETSPIDFDSSSGIESVEELTRGTHEEPASIFFTDFDLPPSSIYSKEEQDSW